MEKVTQDLENFKFESLAIVYEAAFPYLCLVAKKEGVIDEVDSRSS